MRVSIFVPLACAGLHTLLVAVHLSLLAIWVYGAEHAVVFPPQIASSVQTYTSLVSQIIIIVSGHLCIHGFGELDTIKALHRLARLSDAICDITGAPLWTIYAHVPSRYRERVVGFRRCCANPLETSVVSFPCGRAGSSDALPHFRLLLAHHNALALLCTVVRVLSIQPRYWNNGHANLQCIVGARQALRFMIWAERWICIIQSDGTVSECYVISGRFVPSIPDHQRIPPSHHTRSPRQYDL